MSTLRLDNVISSDDLNSRRDELRDGRADLCQMIEDFTILIDDPDTSPEDLATAKDGLDKAKVALDKWDDENGHEFKILDKVCEDGSNYVDDWDYGVTLIHEDEFDDYAEELAKDTCDVPRSQWGQWPFNCIDWKEAANELKQDYTTVEIDGETYYAR